MTRTSKKLDLIPNVAAMLESLKIWFITGLGEFYLRSKGVSTVVNPIAVVWHSPVNVTEINSEGHGCQGYRWRGAWQDPRCPATRSGGKNALLRNRGEPGVTYEVAVEPKAMSSLKNYLEQTTKTRSPENHPVPGDRLTAGTNLHLVITIVGQMPPMWPPFGRRTSVGAKRVQGLCSCHPSGKFGASAYNVQWLQTVCLCRAFHQHLAVGKIARLASPETRILNPSCASPCCSYWLSLSRLEFVFRNPSMIHNLKARRSIVPTRRRHRAPNAMLRNKVKDRVEPRGATFRLLVSARRS